MKKFLTFLFAMAAVVLFCCASPVKSVNSSKPERVSKVVKYATSMHCKNCENKIKTNIRFVKGVKNHCLSTIVRIDATEVVP